MHSNRLALITLNLAENIDINTMHDIIVKK